MDAISDPDIQYIYVMSSAQVGKTESILNTIGYYAHHDPSPILLIQPTLEMAEAFSKDRLAPMIRDTPELRERFPDPKSRDSGNTMLHKRYPGGHITMAGSNSSASLASRPIRVVLGDELDRWPVSAGTEGDPWLLAIKRTTTFYNRKIVAVSTPTIAGASRIETLYGESDKRRYWVPCVYCGEHQALNWSQVIWPKYQPENASYECEHCKTQWTETDRRVSVRRGEWRADSPETMGIAGFHINELYSPWRKLSEIAADFLRAKKSPQTLQTWINTSLGETWEDEGDQVEPDLLTARREDYAAECPKDALLLTAGVDVQEDRLEVYIYGWNELEECWAVDGFVLYGNPTQQAVWSDLDQALQSTYHHTSGAQIGVSACCIDSGYQPDYVYEFVRTRIARKVFATKGQGGWGLPLVGRPSQKQRGKDRRKVPLYPIGVDDAKALLQSRLRISEPGSGYIHVPANHSLFGEEYAAQMTAEKLKTVKRKGFPMKEWHKIRPRNEALDCWILALAALRLARPNWKQLSVALSVEQVTYANPKKSKPLKRSSGGAGSWL